MNFDRVNKWVTLGANIGVLLGLIILIIEVRQNASLSRAALEVDANNALSAIEFSLAMPHSTAAWVKSVRAPEAMTDEEIRLVEAHLVAVMQQWNIIFQLEDVGLANRTRVEKHIRNTAPYYFGSAHAKNWWRLQEQGWKDTSMYEVAGPIVDALDPDFLRNYLEASRIAAGPAATEEPAQ